MSEQVKALAVRKAQARADYLAKKLAIQEALGAGTIATQELLDARWFAEDSAIDLELAKLGQWFSWTITPTYEEE